MAADMVMPWLAFAADVVEGAGDHGSVGWFSPENTYFWVGLGFVVFIALIARQAWGAIGRALDARAAGIERQIQEARLLRDEAQKQLAEDQRRQRQAAKDAEAIVEQAREDAKALKAQAEKDAAALVDRRTQAVESRIAQLQQSAVAEVRAAAAHAAVAATRQTLQDAMTGDTGRQALDAAIAEVDKSLH
ncbi:hypothetical protein CCR80_12675 [Rhodothalassium salexigens]|uniref:F0F1 ATP synthase subunit B family protein n=1 Tax=Rhodothalassium salexigens TaxID=1086 RepID=UPI001914C865|nr:hypothetical protein [Rhodothalassium salexigens]MBK5921886.1 hypothetical protein [Rhodothalassium salexigens]